MKKLYKLSVITVLLFLFAGCDYYYNYTYVVSNQSDKVITLRTTKIKNNYFTIEDSIYTIKPNEAMKIIDEDGGTCGLYYLPESRYKENDTILRGLKFDIYIKDTLALQKLKLFKCWSCIAKKRLGKYELKITNDLLDLK